MELEGLKTAWGVLGERLERNEILDKRIVKEMILGRSDDAIGRLYKYDVFAAAACAVIFLALLVTAILLPIGSALGRYGIVVVPAAGVIWSVIKLRLIGRIDPRVCSLTEVSALLAKYKLWNIKEVVIGVPAVFIALTLVFMTLPVFPWQGLVVFVAGMLLLPLEYGYYKRNVEKAEAVLQELKEFEEEPESE